MYPCRGDCFLLCIFWKNRNPKRKRNHGNKEWFEQAQALERKGTMTRDKRELDTQQVEVEVEVEAEVASTQQHLWTGSTR